MGPFKKKEELIFKSIHALYVSRKNNHLTIEKNLEKYSSYPYC
jgi:hypothetical protein